MGSGADGGAVLVRGVVPVDVRLMYIFYTYAIFLNQAKGGFESLLLCVHIFELILCRCALDALNLYHLVRLDVVSTRSGQSPSKKI